MGAWGLKDNIILSGNVTTSNASPIVQGFGGSLFFLEVDDGDYVAIAGNKYQVHNVTSNIALTLTANAATNSANVKAYVQQGPKYLRNADVIENVYSIQTVLGLDSGEAGVLSNRAKNLKVPGWNHFKTYTDAHGQTRYKAEVLVCLSKNFDASAAGDWADDATLLDYLLYFTLQPVDKTPAANASTTLQVAALSAPVGAAITYQWYESPNNIVFATLSNTGVYSGTATNTLAISNVANVNGRFYKVTIANTLADTNTSDTVTITHA